MGAYDLVFTGSTTAALVAGRALSSGSLDLDGLRDLCEAIDALAEELGEPLVAVVSGDFTARSGVYTRGDDRVGDVAVGVLVAAADAEEPTRVVADGVAAELARAASLPWDSIAALFPEADRRALAEAPIRLLVAATGPLAGVQVAFGVSASLDDVPPPGLDRIRGQAMGQEPPFAAVHGVQVSWLGWDATFPGDVDLAGEAHAERVRRLGSLADASSYWLIGHYD